MKSTPNFEDITLDGFPDITLEPLEVENLEALDITLEPLDIELDNTLFDGIELKEFEEIELKDFGDIELINFGDIELTNFEDLGGLV